METTTTPTYEWQISIDHFLGNEEHTEYVALFSDRHDALHYAGLMRDTIGKQDPIADRVIISATSALDGSVLTQHHVLLKQPPTDPELF
jgi:hypothetical protein